MIREVIITTLSKRGVAHVAPMGVHVVADEMLVMPFRPSATLQNMLETGHAVMNYCDDVRIFAGCVTGRREWPLVSSDKGSVPYLAVALAHSELVLTRVEDNEIRPKLFCQVVHEETHAPFLGFNRAQYSVLEAAILASRLHMLPRSKVESELAYLRIGFDKTAGPIEHEAWGWLMARFDAALSEPSGERGPT